MIALKSTASGQLLAEHVTVLIVKKCNNENTSTGDMSVILNI